MKMPPKMLLKNLTTKILKESSSTFKLLKNHKEANQSTKTKRELPRIKIITTTITLMVMTLMLPIYDHDNPKNQKPINQETKETPETITTGVTVKERSQIQCYLSLISPFLLMMIN